MPPPATVSKKAKLTSEDVASLHKPGDHVQDDGDARLATTGKYLTSTKSGPVRASECINLIRELVANVTKEHGRPEIDLSVGDPTKFGGVFSAADVLKRCMVEVVTKEKVDGYAMSIGDESCRKAIADHYQVPWQKVQITAGCSSSIDITLRALAGTDDIVLVPVPGFPLYETLLKLNNIGYARYSLDPSNDWRVSLQSMAEAVPLADRARVKLVFVCNPSNPTGSVYPEEHLHQVLAFVKDNYPNAAVLADQVYEDVVFEGTFTDMGPIGLQLDLPVVAVSSLAKGYHAPGWRMGWIISYDARNELDEFRRRVWNLSNTTMGAASIIQHAFRRVLTNHTDEVREFRAKADEALREAVDVFVDGLDQIPGVEVCRPKGAMYIMFKLPVSHMTSTEICVEMLKSERLLLLPGDACFGAPTGFVRALVALPTDVAKEAVNRIARFCARMREHSANTTNGLEH